MINMCPGCGKDLAVSLWCWFVFLINVHELQSHVMIWLNWYQPALYLETGETCIAQFRLCWQSLGDKTWIQHTWLGIRWKVTLMERGGMTENIDRGEEAQALDTQQQHQREKVQHHHERSHPWIHQLLQNNESITFQQWKRQERWEGHPWCWYLQQQYWHHTG